MKGHIRNRGNQCWQLCVYLGVENGKKKYKYQTVHGTQKSAERALKKLVRQVENNEPDKNITLGEFLDIWLRDYVAVNNPNSYARESGIVKNHLKPKLGHIKLLDLKPFHLQQFYSETLNDGRIQHRRVRGKGLSPLTVRRIHGTISAALNKAVLWEFLDKDIISKVKPPKAEKHDVKVLEKDDMIYILNTIYNQYPVMYMPTLLAITFGLRRKEVLGLTWKNTSFENTALRVTRQLQVSGKELKLIPPKSKKSYRTLLISNYVMDKLHEQKEWQTKNRKEKGKYYNDTDFICTWDDGRPIMPDYVTSKFKKIITLLGYNVRFHDLRHSYATFMLSNNVPTKVVSEILGHSGTGITLDLYSHVTPSMQEKAAAVIDKLFE